MKILMIGLGSIGQRHLRNIRSLYGNEVEIIAYRVRGLPRTFSNDLKIRENVILEDEFNIKSYKLLEDALASKPDIAFITNITSAHMECAIKAIKAGCDIFLEKPISNNMDGVRELLESSEKYNKIVFVGFQNRYHICLLKLKEYLDAEAIGNIVAVHVEMGEQLTTMHTYEDYRETYMAQVNQGGGVILNQQIHELDYVQWLFGRPLNVYAVNGNTGSLNIDVEDYDSSLYLFHRNGYSFPVFIHANFFQKPPQRTCKVIGANGWITVDLLQPKIELYRNGKEQMSFHFDDFQRNDMFIKELTSFMDSVRTRNIASIPLEEAIISMQMALASKKSGRIGQPVQIDDITW